jgi:cytochrome b561
MADVRPIIPADFAYTRTAIALHWLTLLLIATGFSLGRWMVELPIAPQTLRVYAYHKWIGITVFLLTLARLAWRRAHPVPPPPGLPAWQRRAAAASHASLYVLMLMIPLSGWVYSSASGVQVVYLGVIPLPNLVPKDDALAHVLKSVHFALNFTLLALVLVHAGAAIKHHLVDRDRVLSRMLPALASRNKEPSQ